MSSVYDVILENPKNPEHYNMRLEDKQEFFNTMFEKIIKSESPIPVFFSNTLRNMSVDELHIFNLLSDFVKSGIKTDSKKMVYICQYT